MLIQFSVKNFMSIKNEVTLSMVANKNDKEHSEQVFSVGSDTVLTSVAIYGANAAGKSNVFKALATAVNLVRMSKNRQINDRMSTVVPFLFDHKTKEEPTSFDFIFVSNGKKYQYGFTLNKEKIIEEYLTEYKTAWPSMIFERSETIKYKFTKSKEREFKEYVDKNSDNKLFLSTATLWNCEHTKDAYLWFEHAIDIYDINDLAAFSFQELEKDHSDLQQFLLKMLKKADINIEGFSTQVREISVEELIMNGLPPEMVSLINNSVEKTGKQLEIFTNHLVQTEKGEVLNIRLPFNMESSGTQIYFFIAILIKSVMEQGKTILIDELDTSIHPLLVRFIIEMFHDNETNTNHAQLIFSSHDVSLLTLDQFRRDQIYFVEKNNSTGVTDLYSLDEFSPRKTENIRTGYLQGRYGAIPVIDGVGKLW